jgi:Lamin Tail Domain
MPTRTWILCGAFVALLAAVAGVALAAIPGPDGRIHGCRNVKTGVLRVIGDRAHCRDNEKRLNWNVRGPRGPEGPMGPAGPQGEPGPGLTSFDELAGLACTRGANTGEIEIGYDAASGDARIRCAVPAPPAAPIRVNEFSTGVEGALTDEFVEIFNPGTEPADLSGYKLVYRSAAGTSDVVLLTVANGTALAPGAFLFFGGSGYAGTAHQSFSGSLASGGGGVGIRDATGLLLDSVGWGTATNAFVEGSAAAAPTVAPAPGKSGARHPDGADANDNAVDFTEDDPTPGGAN